MINFVIIRCLLLWLQASKAFACALGLDQDGTTSGVYDAVFGNDQTNTVYHGESGQAAWAGATAIDVKGFGRITNLAVATANDFGLAELVASRSAAMTTPDLHTLAVQAGDVLRAWGASLNLSRELTPVLTPTDGKTLLDRAIYVEFR